jgi:hypothetical protein
MDGFDILRLEVEARQAGVGERLHPAGLTPPASGATGSGLAPICR